MDFTLAQDQLDLQKVLRNFFAQEYEQSRLRDVVDEGAGHDPRLWSMLAQDLGLAGLPIAEGYGGSGGSEVDLAILWEEYGRALVSSPLLASLGFAVPALRHAATEEARAAWLPRLAQGEATATWALLDRRGEPDLVGADVSAAQTADGWQLTGHRSWVLDGGTADLVLTMAATDSGPALFLVETASGAGLERIAATSLDPTLALGHLALRKAPAHRLTEGPDCAGIERALDSIRMTVAALQLGCLDATLDAAVEHAAGREQFGRPIGGFQAIKHRCADIFMDAETTRWVVYHVAAAASDAATSATELHEEVILAGSHAAPAVFRAAANLLQILGGIGYTWEHDGHLYFKRATVSARLLGSSQHRLDAIASFIDDRPSPVPDVGTTTPRSTP